MFQKALADTITAGAAGEALPFPSAEIIASLHGPLVSARHLKPGPTWNNDGPQLTFRITMENYCPKCAESGNYLNPLAFRLVAIITRLG